MTFYDMLCMSAGNLWRRKLRTLLTILGVLIGTASIVAMLSIALGMKQMVMDEYSNYGSATQITVNQGMSDGNSGSSKDSLMLTESNLKLFEDMQHVTGVEPELRLDMTLQQGKYQGWMSLVGVSKKTMEEQEVGEGELPGSGGSSRLEVLAGNSVIVNFWDSTNTSDEGYWSTGELPDVDLLNRSVKATVYNENATNETVDTVDSQEDTETGEETGTVPESEEISYETPIIIKITGVMSGGPDDWKMNSEALLVDMDNLKNYLTKNFKRGAIPGQPMNSKGQPFSEWVYNSVTVNVDESSNVEVVMQEIQDMGFQASSNKELLESAQQTFRIIELVLGGIGMIAFLVAAIGIANTMMMSTYERTKEIGIMKVLGCDMRDILKLFLSEAGFIGFIGGVAGLLFTMLLSAAANAVAAGYLSATMGMADGKISIITWWLALIAVVFATLMGMIAGFFPARRAMKLSPLAAIRNE